MKKTNERLRLRWMLQLANLVEIRDRSEQRRK